MNYFSAVPSLKQAASIRTAISLWTANNRAMNKLNRSYRYRISELLYKILFGREQRRDKCYVTERKDLENSVTKRISDLPLAPPLKEKLIGFIRPVGLELLNWGKYHKEFLCGSEISVIEKILIKLCWTSRGTVDKKKTAEALVRDENIDATKRYKLACLYCLEDNLVELWNSMSEREKGAFYIVGYPNYINNQNKLVVFWTYYLQGKIDELTYFLSPERGGKSPYEFACDGAAVNDSNRVAFEYFITKINPMDRLENVMFNQPVTKKVEDLVNLICARVYVMYERVNVTNDMMRLDDIDLLFFILSLMNEEQQLRVFQDLCEVVLYCLLDWPWQPFFMETANRVWSFLDESKFECLVDRILDKAVNGYKDWNYQKLFGEFWQQSPAHVKDIFISTKCKTLIPKLLDLKDKGNLELILRSLTTGGRKALLVSREGRINCEHLIHRNEKDMLEFYIQVCTNLPPENILMNFKKEFKRKKENKCSQEEKRDWNKFFKLLDDFIKNDDETINSRKKKKCL